MEKKFLSNGLVSLTAAKGCKLHEAGTESSRVYGQITVKAQEAENWEDVEEAGIPPYGAAEYKARVVALVRERYDADDETAILRQRDSKPQEFAEYYAYVEGCKARARAELIAEGGEQA